MQVNHHRLLSIILFFIIIFQGQPPVYANDVKVNHYAIVNDTLAGKCSKKAEIEKIIGDAIALGAPIYNAGLHIGCYRIYEWAAYKILYEYGKNCLQVEKVLKKAIEKSHGDYSDTEKAWMMRAAFDRILGVPTTTGEPEKPTVPGNG